MDDVHGPAFHGNPLVDDSPEVWDELVRALRPAHMLVLIRRCMQAELLLRIGPEDIWQETLLHVWRDRAHCEWRGLSAFRSWVVRVVENRIRDAADREFALKRGGGSAPQPYDAGGARASAPPPPVASTTPSRIACYAEEARSIERALAELPEELRQVVLLRLFESRPVLEVSERLGIGESAVKHRLRKGIAAFQSRVRSRLEGGPPGLPRTRG